MGTNRPTSEAGSSYYTKSTNLSPPASSVEFHRSNLTTQPIIYPMKIHMQCFLRKQKAMAAITQLKKNLIEYTTSLYSEGYLNSQFMELKKMQDQDKSDPNFLVNLVSLYLEDSGKLLNILKTTFQHKPVDYKQVALQVHRLKGSSSNIGVPRIMSVCDRFINFCQDKHLDGCLWCLEQVNHEYIIIRNKLGALFKMEQQILQAGGSIPTME